MIHDPLQRTYYRIGRVEYLLAEMRLQLKQREIESRILITEGEMAGKQALAGTINSIKLEIKTLEEVE